MGVRAQYWRLLSCTPKTHTYTFRPSTTPFIVPLHHYYMRWSLDSHNMHSKHQQLDRDWNCARITKRGYLCRWWRVTGGERERRQNCQRAEYTKHFEKRTIMAAHYMAMSVGVCVSVYRSATTMVENGDTIWRLDRTLEFAASWKTLMLTGVSLKKGRHKHHRTIVVVFWMANRVYKNNRYNDVDLSGVKPVNRLGRAKNHYLHILVE